MQGKKYCKIMMGILCFAALLTGCGKEKETVGTSELQDQNEFRPMINITESEDGVYYVQQVMPDANTDYMVLKYVDKISAKETVLCQKVNCKHNSEECQAVAENASYMGFMTCIGERLYYMVCGPFDAGLYLYSVNKDGTDKQMVHKFNSQTPPNAAGMYKGKLFLSIPTMIEFEDGTGSESAEPELIMYDLKTDEETLILESRESIYTVPCGGSGDSIYIFEMKLDEKEEFKFRQYDFQSQEVCDILDGEITNAQLIMDDTLYLQTEGKNKIESYNLKTKKREEVLTYDEECNFVYMQIGYIELIRRTKTGDKISDLCKWYDLKEKKYLFDDFESGEEVYVRRRLEDGRYWVEKDDKIYFYDLNNKSFTEVEEVK